MKAMAVDPMHAGCKSFVPRTIRFMAVHPSQRRRQCADRFLEVVPACMQSLRQLMRDDRGGLTIPQFRLLLFLGREPGATLAEAASFIGIGAPTASAMIKILQRKKLVTSVRGADRRTVALAPSRTGTTLITSARTAARRKVVHMLAALPTADLGRLERGLAVLASCCPGRPHAEASS